MTALRSAPRRPVLASGGLARAVPCAAPRPVPRAARTLALATLVPLALAGCGDGRTRLAPLFNSYQDNPPVLLSEGNWVELAGQATRIEAERFVLDSGTAEIGVDVDNPFGTGERLPLSEGERVIVSGLVSRTAAGVLEIEAEALFSVDQGIYSIQPSARDEELNPSTEPAPVPVEDEGMEADPALPAGEAVWDKDALRRMDPNAADPLASDPAG